MFSPQQLILSLITVGGCLAIGDQSPPVIESILRDDVVNYRLPNHTHPETYELSLFTRIDEADFEFNGLVKIKVLVDRTTREVVLHSRNLAIENVRMSRFSGSVPIEVRLLPYEYDDVREFLMITTDGVTLTPGDRLLVEISYIGTLRTDGAGFFRTSYTNANGNKTWLAATQFEAVHARLALPCYDEPALKAKFKIQITHGKRYHALSNMQQARFENSDDTATTAFPETPLMSTYLLAFVISDFHNITNFNASRAAIPHRVFARSAVIESAKLALTFGEQALSKLEEYVAVNYTLPKMDQVAVPDFQFEAMENWGIVTYAEEYLLYNETIHSHARKYNVCTYIAHEFGHQYFGNLVSPKWWQWVWLNEGFAAFLEHAIPDLIHPEWNIAQMFITSNLHVALRSDSKIDTRPMTFYVEKPIQVAKLFDDIAYEKSASVIRMFQHVFTETTFRKGLKYYLTKMAGSPAEESDLFAAFDRAVKEDQTLDESLDIPTIFSSWSQLKGYPVLMVQRIYNRRIITLTQKRFIKSLSKSIKNTSAWWIPYNYVTALQPNFNDTAPMGWLTPGDTSRTFIVTPSAKEWILFNKQQTGFYRVHYDEHNLKLLSAELNSANYTVIHVINRAALLDDTFEFFEQGLVKSHLFFGLFEYMRRETEFLPWKVAGNIVNKLALLLSGSNRYLQLKAYLMQILEEPFHAIGIDDLDDEPMLRKFTRTVVVNLACEFEVKACLNSTYAVFSDFLHSGRPIRPNRIGFIYANGIRNATDVEVNRLWYHLNNTRETDERLEIIGSFAYVQNRDLLDEYIVKTVHVDAVDALNKEERNALFDAIIKRSEYGLRLGMRLLRNHPMDTKQYLNEPSDIVNRLAARVVTSAAREKFYDLLVILKTTEHITESEAGIAKQIADENFLWLDQHQKSIEKWLSNPHKSAASSLCSWKTQPLFYLTALFLIKLL